MSFNDKDILDNFKSKQFDIESWYDNIYMNKKDYKTVTKTGYLTFCIINTDALKYLLENINLLNDTDQVMIKKVHKIQKNGLIPIYHMKNKIYLTPLKFEETGRLYPYCNVGPSSWSRFLRCCLLYNTFEIDGKTMHQTLLNHILIKNNISNKWISKYIREPNKYRNELAKLNNISYKKAKSIINSLMYKVDGQDPKQYFALRYKTKFTEGIKQEFREASKILITKFKLEFKKHERSNKIKYHKKIEYYNKYGSSKSGNTKPYMKCPKSTTISYLCANMERNILMEHVDLLIEYNIIDAKYKNVSLIHDGLLINLKHLEYYKSKLNEIESKLRIKSGINQLSFGIKQFDIEEFDTERYPILKDDKFKLLVTKFQSNQIGLDYKECQLKLDSNYKYAIEDKKKRYSTPFPDPLIDSRSKNIIKYDNKYLQYKDFYKWVSNHDILAIRSSMGSGKSTVLRKWLSTVKE
jgi:hypothetical protein